MASEKLDFAEFLAVLEARRAALDALIASYRNALSLGALGQPGDVDLTSLPTATGIAGGAPMELPTGALLGKSIPAAIKLYLSAVKKKLSAREITAALREAGVESTATNFEGTVTGALHRLKAAGDVLRFKDGWALAEFYPESLRSRIAKEAEPKKRRGRQKKAAKPTAENTVPARPRRAIQLKSGPLDLTEKAG